MGQTGPQSFVLKRWPHPHPPFQTREHCIVGPSHGCQIGGGVGGEAALPTRLRPECTLPRGPLVTIAIPYSDKKLEAQVNALLTPASFTLQPSHRPG